MAELPQVVPGEPVQSTTFGNPVIDRVISRYPDATARDFAVPLPQPGDPAYLTATDELQIYNGTEWETYAIDAEKVNVAGDTMTGELYAEARLLGQAAGQITIDGQDVTARLVVRRDGVTELYRLALGAGGDLVIQQSTDVGATWVTALQVNPDRQVEFPLPTISTAPGDTGDNPGYGFASGGGVGRNAGGTTVGLAGPNGDWVAACTNFQFTVTDNGVLELAIATAFTVPKVWSETTTDAPNVSVNSGGAIRRSTSVVALQADLEALEAQVATLQATVDAL